MHQPTTKSPSADNKSSSARKGTKQPAKQPPIQPKLDSTVGELSSEKEIDDGRATRSFGAIQTKPLANLISPIIQRKPEDQGENSFINSERAIRYNRSRHKFTEGLVWNLFLISGDKALWRNALGEQKIGKHFVSLVQSAQGVLGTTSDGMLGPGTIRQGMPYIKPIKYNQRRHQYTDGLAWDLFLISNHNELYEQVVSQKHIGPAFVNLVKVAQRALNTKADGLLGPGTQKLGEQRTRQLKGAKGLLVSNDQEPESTQMKIDEFLELLEGRVCSTVNNALKGTEYTADSCPYLLKIFRLFSVRTPAEVEGVIRKYASETVQAQRAADYITILMRIIPEKVKTWLNKPDKSMVPEEYQFLLPKEKKEASAVGGEVRAKEDQSGSVQTKDPESVRKELGEGSSFGGTVKDRMESGFGTSFSDLQLHTDSKASKLSGDMNARAFTVGNHIAFKSGEYQPGTPVGDALIAHELAHVEQQRGTATDVQSKGSQTTNAGTYQQLEEDADNSAVGVVSRLYGKGIQRLQNFGKEVKPRLKTGLKLQRCIAARGEAIYHEGNAYKEYVKEKSINLTFQKDFAKKSGTRIQVDPPHQQILQYSSPTYTLIPGEKLGSNKVLFSSHYGKDLKGKKMHGLHDFADKADNGYRRKIEFEETGEYTIRCQYTGANGETKFIVIQQTVIPFGEFVHGKSEGDLDKQSSSFIKELVFVEQELSNLLSKASNTGEAKSIIGYWITANHVMRILEHQVNGDNPDETLNLDDVRFFYSEILGFINKKSRRTGRSRTLRNIYGITSGDFRTIGRANQALSKKPIFHYATLKSFHKISRDIFLKKLVGMPSEDLDKELMLYGNLAFTQREILQNNPIKIPAVYYPESESLAKEKAKDRAVKMKDGKQSVFDKYPDFDFNEISLKWYAFREGSKWKLYDATDPNNVKDTDEQEPNDKIHDEPFNPVDERPPRKLFDNLDHPSRFGKGRIYYRIHGKTEVPVITTEPLTAASIFAIIGGALAIAGITVLTAGTGTGPALVAGKVLIGASLAAGAASSIADIVEKSEVGTLTNTDLTLNLLNIATSVLGGGAVLLKSGAIAAKLGVQGRLYAMRLTQVAIAGEATEMLVFTADVAKQFNEVRNSKLSDEDKKWTMIRLIGSAMATYGAYVIGFKNPFKNFKSKTFKEIFDLNKFRPKGMRWGRYNRLKTEVEELLKPPPTKAKLVRLDEIGKKLPGLKRVSEIRQEILLLDKLKRKPKSFFSNIAFGRYEIRWRKGKFSGDFTSVSGKKTTKEMIKLLDNSESKIISGKSLIPDIKDELRLFKTTRGAHDSEIKLLEYLVNRMKDATGYRNFRIGKKYPKIRGRISIFSEYQSCDSCANAIYGQFKKTFPNVDIKFEYGLKYP